MAESCGLGSRAVRPGLRSSCVQHGRSPQYYSSGLFFLLRWQRFRTMKWPILEVRADLLRMRPTGSERMFDKIRRRRKTSSAFINDFFFRKLLFRHFRSRKFVVDQRIFDTDNFLVQNPSHLRRKKPTLPLIGHGRSFLSWSVRVVAAFCAWRRDFIPTDVYKTYGCAIPITRPFQHSAFHMSTSSNEEVF